MLTFTHNEPLHRVQCQTVLVCLVNSYTLTVRRTPVPLTSNCPIVHNQVLHVGLFSS